MIEAEKANYSIVWMCGLLGVPRSSFYAWRDRAQTASAVRRRELAEHVTRVFDNNRGVYGCRRVAAALNREGQRCSVGQFAEHMRTSLVLDVLAMAIDHRYVQAGAIFHSDRGCQYTSAAYTEFCTANGVRTSVGRTGVC